MTVVSLYLQTWSGFTQLIPWPINASRLKLSAHRPCKTNFYPFVIYCGITLFLDVRTPKSNSKQVRWHFKSVRIAFWNWTQYIIFVVIEGLRARQFRGEALLSFWGTITFPYYPQSVLLSTTLRDPFTSTKYFGKLQNCRPFPLRLCTVTVRYRCISIYVTDSIVAHLLYCLPAISSDCSCGP